MSDKKNPKADVFFFLINFDNKAFLTGLQKRYGNGCTDKGGVWGGGEITQLSH